MNSTQIKTVVIGIFAALFVLLLLPGHARYDYVRDGTPRFVEMNVTLGAQVFAVSIVAVITALIAYRWRTHPRD